MGKGIGSDMISKEDSQKVNEETRKVSNSKHLAKLQIGKDILSKT